MFYDRFIESALDRLGYSRKGVTIERAVLNDMSGGSEVLLSTETRSWLTGEIKLTDPELAMKVSWVFSNVDAISKLGAVSKFQVWDVSTDGQDVLTTEHPLHKLLRRPNKFMGSAFLRRYTIMWLLLKGEAYWMILKNRAGEPAELWPIPSDRIEPIADRNQYIKHYKYKTIDEAGREKFLKIPAERIIYFREPHPFKYHRGMGKIEAARIAVKTDLASQGWNLDSFDNEATVRTLISLPAEIGNIVYERIKAELLDELINKRKRYIIARAGTVDVNQMGLSAKDMEYLNGREFTRKEIDRIFGLPPGFWSDSATEANIKVAKEVVTEITIWPILEMMADQLNTQLLEVHYKEDAVALDVKADDIRPKNIALELQKEERAFETMTVNEVRKAKNLPEYENEYGDLPWVLRHSEQTVPLFLQEFLAEKQARAQEFDPTGRTVDQGVGSATGKQESTPVVRSKKPKDKDDVVLDPEKIKKAAEFLASEDFRRWKLVAEKSRAKALRFSPDALPDEVALRIKDDLAACDTPQEMLEVLDRYATLY